MVAISVAAEVAAATGCSMGDNFMRQQLEKSDVSLTTSELTHSINIPGFCELKHLVFWRSNLYYKAFLHY